MVEEQWQAKMRKVEANAERSKQATEAKVAGIIERLHSLAEKESKREGQRGQSLSYLPFVIPSAFRVDPCKSTEARPWIFKQAGQWGVLPFLHVRLPQQSVRDFPTP